MADRASRCTFVALAVSFAVAAQETREGASGLQFSGYFKSLATRSKTVIGPEERYTLDLNRLRLKLQGPVSTQTEVDIQYDNEILLGDYLKTAQFAAEKDLRAPTYFDLEKTYADHPGYYGQHSFYRASVTVRTAVADAKLGRQRIAWGTGRFWNPLDIFNPPNPARLEREERPGVDGALIERKLGPLSRVSLAYVPRADDVASSFAAYGHGNAAGWDFSLVGGRFHGDGVVGGDFASQIGGLGVRGEATYTDARAARNYGRVLLGADYGFVNTLTLTGELYYNGQGTRDPAQYDFARLFAGEIQNLAQRYAAAYASYEITPLLETANYYIRNFDDGSQLVWLSLAYSLTANVELAGGIQIFSGRPDSEYGRLPNRAYVQVQWFF